MNEKEKLKIPMVSIFENPFVKAVTILAAGVVGIYALSYTLKAGAHLINNWKDLSAAIKR